MAGLGKRGFFVLLSWEGGVVGVLYYVLYLFLNNFHHSITITLTPWIQSHCSLLKCSYTSESC